MAYNVLIVDDSSIIRSTIRKVLQISRIEVGEIFEAENGKDALQQIEDHPINIVLADINMPVMNGLEMVDIMAQKGMLDKLPVIIISTERNVTRMAELKAKGVRAYLNKPFTPENIQQVVNNIMGAGDI